MIMQWSTSCLDIRVGSVDKISACTVGVGFSFADVCSQAPSGTDYSLAADHEEAIGTTSEWEI